ncbi:RNA recognition motif domain-containing protein [Thiolapillus sp.]
MVILLSDLPDKVKKKELKQLVEQYHPVRQVVPCAEYEGKCVEWRVELGDADREVANYVTDKLNGYYWKGCHLNAYCPIFQSSAA